MRVRPGFLLGLVIVFVVIPFIAAFVLPAHVGGKPTRGERAAWLCRDYLVFAKSASVNGKFSLDFSNLSAFAKTNAQFPVTIFSTNADFWAKTNFDLNSTLKEPVIVCKTKYFFRRDKNSFGCSFTPLKAAYAIGYADGTAKLVTEEQFTNLNLNGFVSLQNLATNSEFGIFKP